MIKLKNLNLTNDQASKFKVVCTSMIFKTLFLLVLETQYTCAISGCVTLAFNLFILVQPWNGAHLFNSNPRRAIVNIFKFLRCQRTRSLGGGADL